MIKSRPAIAFDFDGTLIPNGLDKIVFAMYSAYVALSETRYVFLLMSLPQEEILERLRKGIMVMPGAPRFQQLSAMINALIHDHPTDVTRPWARANEAEAAAVDPQVQGLFSDGYSALNHEANGRFWRPYPSVVSTLKALRDRVTLFMASGVPQTLLEGDLKRHGIDLRFFEGVYGADPSGHDDKKKLLEVIRRRGFNRLLFVGDTHRDQFYAAQAQAEFYRIQEDGDFPRLEGLIRQGHWPDERQPWGWTDSEIHFCRIKAHRMVEAYAAGRPLTVSDCARWVADGARAPER